MLNQIAIMGRLTKDPELRTTPNGKKVTSFTVASERSYVKAGAERQVDWIDVVAWGQTAEFVCKYFNKGKLIVLDGSLQTRSYTDREGRNHKAYEVIASHVYFSEAQKREHDDFSQIPPWDDADFPQIDDSADLPF